MATRAQARASLRDLVNDAGSPPLWSDSALNAALVDAIARYGAWRPLSAKSTLTIASGTTVYALPAAVVPDNHFELYDENWNRIPPAPHAHLEPGPGNWDSGEQAWWQHAGELHLTRKPSAAADWSILHFTGRVCPTNDVDQLPIVAGDEPIIWQLAAAQLYERRAADDAKRSDKQAWNSQQVAAHHRAQAALLMQRYRRIVRAGSTQR